MRKPRDIDAELKALNDKARQLKERKLHQLGELVIATGADVFPVEQLAGLLLSGVESKDAAIKEGWRKRGAGFFQRGTDEAAGSTRRDTGGAAKSDGAASSSGSEAREN
ncbi:MAG: conjugal transfer protein TraD [Sphingomonas sp.]|nr:conjugal transfer protein TraD [Sphingomonas sp.]